MPALQEFAEQIIGHMEKFTPRIEKCLEEISETELWHRPNGHSNSIGNLLLHLCGNMTQYILSSLGGAPDDRVRDAEFAADGGFTKAELLEKLRHTVAAASEVLRNTNEAEWLRVRRVQAFDMSGIGIAIHVCEHYAYHSGQIIFWVKLLKDKDMGFYAGINLNAKNA